MKDKNTGKLYAIHDAKELPFNNPIFQTEDGRLLEDIIKKLIQENPNDRISLKDAMQSMAFIENKELVNFSMTHEALVDLKIETYQTLKQLEQFKISPQDDIMLAYLNNQKEAIKNANTEEGLNGIQAEINAMLFLLKPANEQKKAIIELAQHFESSTNPRLIEKGRMIERAFVNVPLVERSSIAEGKTPAQKRVLAAMEPPTQKKRLHSQIIEASEDTKKFNEFKEKFKAAKPDQDLETHKHLKPPH